MGQLCSVMIVSWMGISIGACQNLILVSLDHIDVVHYVSDVAVEFL